METIAVVVALLAVVSVLIGMAVELEKSNKALIRIACALEQLRYLESRKFGASLVVPLNEGD